MPNSPQVEAANQLIIDTADNPDLRQIFSGKEAGDKCKLTLHLQVMSKTQETVTLAVEKIVTDPSDYYNDEVEPTLKEPIMAMMHRNRKRHRGQGGGGGSNEKEMPMGRHNRPEQTAENSAEPWMKSYT